MAGVMMNPSLGRGLSRITSGLGGSEAMAHRREGVHDDVHPENLHHRERHVGSEQRADEADGDGREVDRQLEQHETLDIAVERTSPHDGRGDRGERIVEQRDVRGVLRHGGSRAHRKTHVGEIERRASFVPSPVTATTSPRCWQQLGRDAACPAAWPGHDLQLLHAFQQLLVAHGGETPCR